MALCSVGSFQAPGLGCILSQGKSRYKHWEREAKAGVEKTTGAEKERDEAKEEDKARVEDDLARVQEALVVVEEARRKAEAETFRLEVERKSLLLQLRAAKDEVSFLHSQASKDKEAMEEDY